MRITVAVARIYGTKNQYGNEPRSRPPDMPLIFTDLPASGDAVRVDLGPVPSELIEAERMRRALGTTMLQSFFVGGRDDLSTQERTDEAFNELDPDALFGDCNWYTTFVLEREVDIDDDASAPLLDFVFTRDVFRLQDDAVRYATPILDVIVTIATSVLDSNMFGQLVLDDRVLLFADGKRPSGVPVLTAGGIAAVTRGGDVPRLGERLSVIRSIGAADLNQHNWLARASVPSGSQTGWAWGRSRWT